MPPTALDPALPGSDPASGTRRLAAGDWVHVSGANPSLSGIGKIVDGEYAPRDAVLLQARVELARGTYWFSPTVLARIEPQDEALLCEEALARGFVNAARADRLRADLGSFERGSLVFVRSPGLLDRLWVALGESDGQAPPGLARMFDEGARVLDELRRRAFATTAAARFAEGDDERAPGGEPAAGRESEPWSGHIPRRQPTRGELLASMLGQLNHERLGALAAGIGIELVNLAGVRELRRDITEAGVPLATVFEALTPRQRDLARQTLFWAPPLLEAIRAVEPWGRLASSSEAWAPGPASLLAEVLEALERPTLERVADSLFINAEGAASAGEVRARLVHARADLFSVLDELDCDELLLCCTKLGLTSSGTLDEIRARILELAAQRAAARPAREPVPARELLPEALSGTLPVLVRMLASLESAAKPNAAEASPRPVPPEPALIHVLRALGRDALRRVAEACGAFVGPGSPEPHIRAKLLNEHIPLARALMVLTQPELVDACRALALPTDTRATYDVLIARILAEEARLAGKMPESRAAERRGPERGHAREHAEAAGALPPASPPPVVLAQVVTHLAGEALVRVGEACDVPTWDGPSEPDLRARIEAAGLALERVLAALRDFELRDLSLALGLPGEGTADELRARIAARA